MRTATSVAASTSRRMQARCAAAGVQLDGCRLSGQPPAGLSPLRLPVASPRFVEGPQCLFGKLPPLRLLLLLLLPPPWLLLPHARKLPRGGCPACIMV